MVFVNFSALLALTMAALAVARPLANKKWSCDAADNVDGVNCHWSRVVHPVDEANKKWSCDDVGNVDGVNCNWSRDASELE
ncbi:hypothetical protein B0H17DRAFT_1088949 [Mycena rosella]|uniref:Uncharacterized protein n=1 Tax=Mycena rosella TaxID=1033263 RepID=A0AAD7G531_MYCRO|nr:hypothetical protein B0H17DRAFT_1088949 [Mycena rosella]